MSLYDKVIAVELSGSPKLYYYLVANTDLVNRSVGDRVVIPNKLKEDGSVSLSIGVYRGIGVDIPRDGLKPIVQFLSHLHLREVQLFLLADAQRAADALAAASKVVPS